LPLALGYYDLALAGGGALFLAWWLIPPSRGGEDGHRAAGFKRGQSATAGGRLGWRLFSQTTDQRSSLARPEGSGRAVGGARLIPHKTKKEEAP